MALSSSELTGRRTGRRRVPRGLVAALLAVALVVAAVLVVRAVVVAAERGPITSALRADATRLRGLAVTVRTADPAGTGPAAERTLAAALAQAPRVTVLATATRADGEVVVEVALWDQLDDTPFSFASPTSAQACARVVARPGDAHGGYGARGTVRVEAEHCAAGVALSAGPVAGSSAAVPAPARLPEVPVAAEAVDVPPVYVPCFSGSNTCPGG